ncbi:hypothetical protein [Rheinheimera oceanensis]|uniref:hypothetical protein n=1 Tax=Rheinheimera oceanensis TaxID=2817449 RepID=UPI001BFD1884|nr:hypothetical protein [Rheinheimera oceanensis]
MATTETVEDPLKLLSDITLPDPRQKHFTGSLRDRHAVLCRINLHEGVPVEVRQSFETAKNLSLYTWFVYRFHQVSELMAYVTLEMALRNRFLLDYSDLPVPTLAKLLKLASEKQWIKNDRFPSLLSKAKQHAWDLKNFKLASEHDFEKEPEMRCVGPTDTEIAEALAEIDLVGGITNTANKLRNDLAHGSTTLHPQSMSTLKTVSEVINQLFEKL